MFGGNCFLICFKIYAGVNKVGTRLFNWGDGQCEGPDRSVFIGRLAYVIKLVYESTLSLEFRERVYKGKM